MKKGYKNTSYHTPKECPHCKSKSIVKFGYRYNCTKKKQRWKCKDCSKLWVVDDGFFKMKKTRELVTQCLNLYLNGMSLRKVARHINQFSEVKTTYRSVHNWLMKYSFMLNPFSQTLNYDLSRVYHVDEIFIKCKGEQHYFWDIIDRDTRVLVANHYSTKRDGKSARRLFMKVEHSPIRLFSDGLQGYRKAYRKVWGQKTRRQDRLIYTRLKQSTDRRNNIIERIQGTIRERIKVMRGFKAEWSASRAFLELFAVYYNFLRYHEGIDSTPIEKAGINLNLEGNQWLNLIYRSKGLF